MNIFTVIVYLVLVIVYFTVFYSPIYLPFLASFALRSRDWREVKWSLRAASGVSLFFFIAKPPGLRHDFGDDVAGNMAGAAHNFPIAFVWVWGGGLICAAVGLIIGLILRWVRLKRWSREANEPTTE